MYNKVRPHGGGRGMGKNGGMLLGTTPAPFEYLYYTSGRIRWQHRFSPGTVLRLSKNQQKTALPQFMRVFRIFGLHRTLSGADLI
jgi:hypothetical protein